MLTTPGIISTGTTQWEQPTDVATGMVMLREPLQIQARLERAEEAIYGEGTNNTSSSTRPHCRAGALTSTSRSKPRPMRKDGFLSRMDALEEVLYGPRGDTPAKCMRARLEQVEVDLEIEGGVGGC